MRPRFFIFQCSIYINKQIPPPDFPRPGLSCRVPPVPPTARFGGRLPPLLPRPRWGGADPWPDRPPRAQQRWVPDRKTSVRGAQLRTSLKPIENHSTLSYRGVKGALNWVPIMPREVSLSDSGCNFFFQSGL